MPLLAMSPNIQDGGTETPSRKRTLMDFLGGANAQTAKAAALATKPSTPSKLQLVTDADNLASFEKEQQKEQNGTGEPTSPIDLMAIDSPLSEMSDDALSLLTDDAGSSTPARRSTSPNATPCKSSAGASPHVVITIDATPPPGLSASATTTTTTTQPPAAKRKRLTPSEREEKAKADAARKLEKEKAEAARKREKEKAEAAKKQERDEQKAAAEAKKKAVAEEKEKKRRQKEEEDRRKNEEKEKKRKEKEDEDRRKNEEKEKKRREKEDEERKIQEAKDKKERSQLRLNSFFKTPSNSSASTSVSSTAAVTTASGSLLPAGSSPRKPAAVRGNSASPRKPTSFATGDAASLSESGTVAAEVSEYDRVFKPFFVKENVVMATDLYGMDDETKEAKSRILDEFLAGSRGEFAPPQPFSATTAVDYFHLPGNPALARGRNRPTVRKIMNMLGPNAMYGGLRSGLDGESDAQTKLALHLLQSTPMKYLFFREDVRPAYFGTVTSQPPTARLSKLARNPLAKTVLPLNYDYDSEAEWVDDGDGEDVDDLDDDEEELDDDGEMSDFLDDSEDAIPLRPAFSGGMEPESTGVCWENEQRMACKPALDSFRMEFILDHDGPIDPFSTQYWETKDPAPAPDATTTASGTPSKSKAMAPPPAPSDAFAALGAGAAAASSLTKSDPATSASSASSTSAAPAAADANSGKAADPKKAGVAAEFVPDLKKSILQYAKLSKLGLVEMLSVEFMGKCTKGQIKNSLEALAERTGTGINKTWRLKA
ncbi:hypothetical protein HMPREF1624_02599 [Sporothrix schenckii ATCC 58251]|uniref:Chromatin assembly factor 1 subunit A n=1 Tax=Sporothrix schenckii (strain ATCC 58251 / de Perez 2211183) TaxID=1391915 RepID=U7Q0B6_SPOS1|nr:hypothetical protein HMPREF1624_02599 [Sporothrix schenckii ATCC 58251]